MADVSRMTIEELASKVLAERPSAKELACRRLQGATPASRFYAHTPQLLTAKGW